MTEYLFRDTPAMPIDVVNAEGNYLTKKLSEFCKPEGKGLCIGFDCKNKNIELECFKENLLVTYYNNRVLLFPALDVGKKEMNSAVEILRRNY